MPELEVLDQTGDSKAFGVGFLKPIQHPTWLVIIVPIKKKNGQITAVYTFATLTKHVQKSKSHC